MQKNQEVVSLVIGCVFEAAVNQSIFCGLFADLCKDIMAYHQQKNQKDGSEKVARASFRRALLNRCQEEFERPQNLKNSTLEEQQYTELRYKQRQIGNIKFISELFRRKMLLEKIMHEVIKRLLLGEARHPDYLPSDEDTAVLHKLFHEAGKLLDRPENAAYMARYYDRITKLAESHPRSRIRFMFQDLIELRAGGWVSRREEEKIQTLAEVENTLAARAKEKTQAIQSLSKYTTKGVQRIPLRQISQSNNTPQGKGNVGTSQIQIGTPPIYCKANGQMAFGTPPSGMTPVHSSITLRNQISTNHQPVYYCDEPNYTNIKIATKEEGDELMKEGSFRSKSYKNDTGNINRQEKLSSEEIELLACRILNEFQTTQQSDVLISNFDEINPDFHVDIISKAIQHSVSSLNKHIRTRVVLTEILRVLMDVETGPDSFKTLSDSIYGGFRQFFVDAFEQNLLEDNPRLWESFADLLVQCVQAFPFPCVQYVIPPCLLESSINVESFVLSIINRVFDIQVFDSLDRTNLLRLLFGEKCSSEQMEILRDNLKCSKTSSFAASQLLATIPY